jgi:hypothetical protein
VLTEEHLANFSIPFFSAHLCLPIRKIKDVSNVIGSVKAVKGENNNMQFIRPSIHFFFNLCSGTSGTAATGPG